MCLSTQSSSWLQVSFLSHPNRGYPRMNLSRSSLFPSSIPFAHTESKQLLRDSTCTRFLKIPERCFEFIKKVRQRVCLTHYAIDEQLDVTSFHPEFTEFSPLRIDSAVKH